MVRRGWLEVVLALPLFAYVLILTIAPILDTARLSFTTPEAGFPTLVAYRAVLGSEIFRRATLNTVVVAGLSLALQLGLGLAVALALRARFPFRGLMRAVMLVPLGVPTIVAGSVMLLVFSRSGYLNALLFQLADLVSLVPGVEWRFVPFSWTVSGGWRTLLTIAIADTWKVLPMVTLLFLAGLESIPPGVYEAADVDGATGWRRFVRITLPLLLPWATMALILRAIDAFRIFELALVLAGRVEPVLGTFIWLRYAPPTSDPHTAAAAAIVLFVMIMVFIVGYLRLVGGRGEVEA